ncbi:hypothetical protein J4401_04520 [Candidatus Woesearchaeota archaeon]|nr:hypothetical protein [Candidatus Woesearchaeota archaeon]
MKLQRQLSKKIGDKEYDKWVIVVKPKIIEELGWKGGQKLKGEIKGNKLVVEKSDE